MHIESKEGISIVYPSDFYDLERTLFCGQAFRWIKIDPTTFFGIHRNHAVIVSQENPGEPIYLTASTEDVTNIWDHYFGFSDNLEKELLSLHLDDFALKCVEKSRGIHILRQDLWEVIISYIISQRNNLNNIGTVVNRISKTLGSPVSLGEYTHYTFPSPYSLACSTDSQWRSFRLGYRYPYIHQIAYEFATDKSALARLNSMGSDEAYYYLCSKNGIGPKVANCILLFGMHRMERFPIDVWIQRIIDQQYSGYLDISRYGKYAGLIQQYMFNYIRN